MKPYSRCVWLTSCVSIEFISNEIVAMENAAESTDGITKRAVTDVSTTIGRLKSRLDLFDRKTISTTHKQVNVYESIGKLCFQNRAAVKLLNIDADIGFLLHTSAFNLPPDQLLYFLDICGGTFPRCVVFFFYYFYLRF